MLLEPLMINGIVKGQKGVYQNVDVIIFNYGLNPRYNDYKNTFTLSIIKSNKPVWTSNWANTQFNSTEDAIVFAKKYVEENF